MNYSDCISLAAKHQANAFKLLAKLEALYNGKETLNGTAMILWCERIEANAQFEIKRALHYYYEATIAKS